MKARLKLHYRTDPLNRLVIENYQSPVSPLRKRVTIAGRFQIDPENSLAYIVSARQKLPAEINRLHKITFTGNWTLDAGQRLKFSLDESKTQVFGDTLVLRGEITRVTGKSIGFLLRERKTPRGFKRRLLRLKGCWQADSINRICFLLDNTEDRLVFKNAWSLNRNNQIIYRRDNTAAAIKFAGFWDINRRNRLSYFLEGTKTSLDFRATLQSPSLLSGSGKIKYRLGIAKKKRMLTLFGRWKWGKRSGLGFEVNYAAGKRKSIKFTFDRLISEKNKLKIELKSRTGKPLGAELVLSRRFLKQAEAFVRLLPRERAVAAAVRIPF
jgi:hypothetical protein